MPPFRLTDSQLEQLMQAAKPLDQAKRALFLERIVAALRLTGTVDPTDADLARALERSACCTGGTTPPDRG